MTDHGNCNMISLKLGAEAMSDLCGQGWDGGAYVRGWYFVEIPDSFDHRSAGYR